MKMLECTLGAVGVSAMRVTAPAHPASQIVGIQLLLRQVRPHSLAGVRLYEVQGSGTGWGDLQGDSKATIKGIDSTSFPTRLGPPPDSPPVN